MTNILFTENQPESTLPSTVSENTAPIVLTDAATNITVSGAVSDGAALKVEQKSSDEDSTAYDINIVDKDGREIQPDGSVTVSIPVPEALKGRELKVYREESSGKYTDMNAKLENNTLVFSTDHFSTYIVSAKDPNETAAAPEITSAATAETPAESKAEGSDDKNVSTGVCLAALPILAAASALAVSRKRK